MELWIRSQDRTTLIRSHEIYISVQRDTYLIRAKRTSHILVSYSTIERALEVLDEIHKLLIPKPIISTYNVEQAKLLDGTVFIEPMLDDIKMESYTSYVYQMPEE